MNKQKLLLRFPANRAEIPIVYHLVKDYDLIVNIFRASITDNEEGYLVIDVEGKQEAIETAIGFMKDQGILLDENLKGFRWNEDICVHCGACISHCPTSALSITDRTLMKISFNSDKCVECLKCIEVCPYGACESLF